MAQQKSEDRVVPEGGVMPVEPREAGRWKRERQNGGTTTLGSV